jgi:hypothetical protein
VEIGSFCGSGYFRRKIQFEKGRIVRLGLPVKPTIMKQLTKNPALAIAGKKTPGHIVDHRSTPIPPENFDVLTASDATLRYYGLHPRPDAKKFPLVARRWEEIYSKKLTYLLPEVEQSERPVSADGGRPELIGQFILPWYLTDPTPYWAGKVVLTPFADAIYFVLGSFKVVKVKQRPGFQLDQYVETFIGIGGFGGPLYCKIGVRQEVIEASTYDSTTFKYTPFMQFGTQRMDITNLPVADGDRISILVCTNNTPTTQGYFYIINETTSKHMTYPFQLPVSSLPPSLLSVIYNTSAEWIVSRPLTPDSAGAAQPPLFEIEFDDAVAYTHGGRQVGAGAGQSLAFNYAGNTATTVTKLSDTSVQITSM